MKILFVVNPKAGSRETNLERRISNFANKNEIDHQVILTKGENDQKTIEEAISAFHPSTVVAAGGDGTVNLVASILVTRQINLGILPAGSANGLAYNLSIPNNIDKALGMLTEKKPKPLDAILLNDSHYCFHLSDAGINARVVKRFKKEGSKGLAGYGKQLIKEMFSSNTYFRATIDTDKIAKNTKAELVVITNVRSFGTGALINPTGNSNDGKFEIVIIRPYPWWFVLRVIPEFFLGRIHKLQHVKAYSTSSANLKFNPQQELQIDGEIIGKVNELKIEVVPNAINVYC